MYTQLPQQLIIRTEVYAIQLFGRNGLERIPPGTVIVTDGHSLYARMIEVTWDGKRYAMFQRDVEERTEPCEQPEQDT